MSISWTVLWTETPRPALRASAGQFFGQGAGPGQHHEHQLDSSLDEGAGPGQHHEHQLDSSLDGNGPRPAS